MKGFSHLTIMPLLVFISMLLCSACSIPKDIYYIIKEQMVVAEDPNDPPPPPPVYYGRYNFILTNDEDAVYLYEWNGKYCPNPSSQPLFLNLSPHIIKKIEIRELAPFLEKIYSGLLKKSVFTGDEYDYLLMSRNFFTSISSPSDTIRNEVIKVIMDFMSQKEFSAYIIRQWTEEERHTLTAKKENLTYDPDVREWGVGFCE